jgi:hypothetical protein
MSCTGLQCAVRFGSHLHRLLRVAQLTPWIVVGMSFLRPSQLERIAAAARGKGSQILNALGKKRGFDNSKSRAAILVPLFNLEHAHSTTTVNGGHARAVDDATGSAHALFTLRAASLSSHGGEVCAALLCTFAVTELKTQHCMGLSHCITSSHVRAHRAHS